MNYRLLVLVVVSALLSACGGDEQSAKVTEAYLVAVKTGNFNAARGYVTKESLPAIDKMEAKADMLGEKAKYPSAVDIEKVNCEVKEQTAICKLCCNEEGLSFQPITLVKEEETWKVSLDEKRK